MFTNYNRKRRKVKRWELAIHITLSTKWLLICQQQITEDTIDWLKAICGSWKSIINSHFGTEIIPYHKLMNMKKKEARREKLIEGYHYFLSMSTEDHLKYHYRHKARCDTLNSTVISIVLQLNKFFTTKSWRNFLIDFLENKDISLTWWSVYLNWFHIIRSLVPVISWKIQYISLIMT